LQIYLHFTPGLAMLISRKIFRDYDIRGVFPGDLDGPAALLIGKALGTVFAGKNVKTVVVGRDDRESSPVLAKKLIEGLLSTGTYIDITLTPIIHYLTCTKGYEAGIMVTASHNPKNFNGFRIDYKNAAPYYGEDIAELWELINSANFKSGSGTYTEENLSLSYIDFIKSKFSFSRKIKIVVDCGSGASSLIAPKIFREMGLNVIPVYCTYDSNFPHGIPDPENSIFLEDLGKKVIANKADVGFGFDTDGDRFGFVDEKGKPYTTDISLLFFAEYVLKENQGKTVLYDVKCSKILDELIPAFGGKPEMIRTGHTYFVKKTLTGEAVLGAEYSGHIFFADKYFGYDDGIYAACRTLEILDSTGLALGDLMSGYPLRESSPELKLSCPDERKSAVVEELKKLLLQDHKFKQLITVDGIRVEISRTGWFLIRSSNTSPYLSVRFEAKNHGELKFIAKELMLLLTPYEEVNLDPLREFLG
jgi:phosphomannomutase/phosphoglucomutase